MTDQKQDTDQQPEEKEFSKGDVGLIATIFGQMSRDAAWTQNQIEGTLQDEVEQWKSAFIKFYNDVKEANVHARNMDIADALYFATPDKNRATKPSWWSPEFKGLR